MNGATMVQQVILSENDEDDISFSLKRHPITGKIYEARVNIVNGEHAAHMTLSVTDLRVASAVCGAMADEWEREIETG